MNGNNNSQLSLRHGSVNNYLKYEPITQDVQLQAFQAIDFRINATSQAKFTSTGISTNNLSVNNLNATNVKGFALNSAITTLGNTTNFGLYTSYDHPITNFYIGDGSGYSFKFNSRNAGTTTQLLSLTDTGVVSCGTLLSPTINVINTSIGNHKTILDNYGTSIGNHKTILDNYGTSIANISFPTQAVMTNISTQNIIISGNLYHNTIPNTAIDLTNIDLDYILALNTSTSANDLFLESNNSMISSGNFSYTTGSLLCNFTAKYDVNYSFDWWATASGAGGVIKTYLSVGSNTFSNTMTPFTTTFGNISITQSNLEINRNDLIKMSYSISAGTTNRTITEKDTSKLYLTHISTKLIQPNSNYY